MKKSISVFTQADHSPGFVLWQVTSLWQRRINAVLREHNLTHAQFVLLAALAWLGRDTRQDITQAQLAQYTKMNTMMVSDVLTTLQRKKLVLRRNHPTDTRAKLITITAQGKRRVLPAFKDVEAADREFFAVSVQEKTVLLKHLKALID